MARKVSVLSGNATLSARGKYKQFFYDAQGERRSVTRSTMSEAVRAAEKECGAAPAPVVAPRPEPKRSEKGRNTLSGNPSKTVAGKYKQGYFDDKGLRRFVTRDTLTEAVTAAHALIKNPGAQKPKRLPKAAPDPTEEAPLTFAEFARRFVEDSRKGRDGRRPLNPQTVECYARLIEQHINPVLGDIPIASVSKANVRQLRDALLQSSFKRTSSIKTLTLAKTILKYAAAVDVIETVPGLEVQIAKDWDADSENKDARVPTLAEVKALDAAALECYHSDDPAVYEAYRRSYPFYVLLRQTGMRSSEIIGLQWGDFSEDFRRVSVRRRVMVPRKGQPQSMRVSRPKSKNGLRTIPLSPDVAAIIEQWREDWPPNPEGWLFATRSGHPVSYTNIRTKWWYALMKRAGVEGYGMHSLRHFYASMVLRDGRVKEASTLLGHHSSAFTMDTYGHLIDDDDATMDRIAEMMSDGMLLDYDPNEPDED